MRHEDVTTLEEAVQIKYGRYGRPYVEGKCVVSVWGSWTHHQCKKSNGHGPGGLFCWQHDPVRRKKEADAEAEARRRHHAYVEKQRHRNERINRVREQAVDALKRAPCKHLLLQQVPVMEAIPHENCEPCTCWRKCLDNLPKE